eukprot:18251-Heterococcus_DN1.PRE.3
MLLYMNPVVAVMAATYWHCKYCKAVHSQLASRVSVNFCLCMYSLLSVVHTTHYSNLKNSGGSTQGSTSSSSSGSRRRAVGTQQEFYKFILRYGTLLMLCSPDPSSSARLLARLVSFLSGRVSSVCIAITYSYAAFSALLCRLLAAIDCLCMNV